MRTLFAVPEQSFLSALPTSDAIRYDACDYIGSEACFCLTVKALLHWLVSILFILNQAMDPIHRKALPLSLPAFLLLLVAVAQSAGWQSVGAMTRPSMHTIWSILQKDLPRHLTEPSLVPLATQISDSLNSQFDVAWNAFVVEQTDPSLDSIIVGKSFREHWMWYNGYAFAGKYFSVLVWKDYNCRTWNSISNEDFVSQSPDPSAANYEIYQTAIRAEELLHHIYEQSPPTKPVDAFALTAKIIKKMHNDHDFTRDYAAVAVQSAEGTKVYGRFCSQGGNYVYKTVKGIDGKEFRAVFFQTEEITIG